MMNLSQALEHGRRAGVRFYIKNHHGCILGGIQTREQAETMKKRFEIEDRRNPWSKGTTRFEITPA